MENGNREKGRYLYATGGFTEFMGEKFDGKAIVKVDIENGELVDSVDEFKRYVRNIRADIKNRELVDFVDEFKRYVRNIRADIKNRELVDFVKRFKRYVRNPEINDDIEHFVIDGNYLYVAGAFTEFKGNKFDGYAVVKVDMRSGELLWYVDGFNDWIKHFVIDGDSVYVTGRFNRFKEKEFNGFPVVKINMRTKELEKVVEEFNGPINHFVIDGDYLYAAGEISEFDWKRSKGFLFVKVDMERKKGRLAWHVDGFNGPINHFVIDGNYLYAAGRFTEFKGRMFHRYPVVKVDMESGELVEFVDGFCDWINHFVIDGNYLYAAGWFTEFEERKVKMNKFYGRAIVEVDWNRREKLGHIDGFDGPINHFEIRSE